jgi:hypothetical protein
MAPLWVWNVLVWVGFFGLKDLLRIWLPIDWASGLATPALFLGLYWATRGEGQKMARARFLTGCLVGSVLSYFMAHFLAR